MKSPSIQGRQPFVLSNHQRSLNPLNSQPTHCSPSNEGQRNQSSQLISWDELFGQR
ncbi:hypothetical protein SynMEDNS5_00988 [Synechococcus sp. MEDNS5]|nr:hypothetical protein SynMEDNS5_00988 [Synechococcus sp. MEDNS5]